MMKAGKPVQHIIAGDLINLPRSKIWQNIAVQIIPINAACAGFPTLAMPAKNLISDMCKDFIGASGGIGTPLALNLGQQVTRCLMGCIYWYCWKGA